MEKKQKISSRQRKEEDRAILKKLINTRNEAPTRRSRKTAKNKIKRHLGK